MRRSVTFRAPAGQTFLSIDMQQRHDDGGVEGFKHFKRLGFKSSWFKRLGLKGSEFKGLEFQGSGSKGLGFKGSGLKSFGLKGFGFKRHTRYPKP